jgi:hypothetical protein
LDTLLAYIADQQGSFGLEILLMPSTPRVGVNLVIYPKTLRAGSVLKIEERLNKAW